VTAVRADGAGAEGVALAAGAASAHAPGFTLVHAGGVLADDKLGAQRAGGIRAAGTDSIKPHDPPFHKIPPDVTD
jgi:hypothetical protein